MIKNSAMACWLPKRKLGSLEYVRTQSREMRGRNADEPEERFYLAGRRRSGFGDRARQRGGLGKINSRSSPPIFLT